MNKRKLERIRKKAVSLEHDIGTLIDFMDEIDESSYKDELRNLDMWFKWLAVYEELTLWLYEELTRLKEKRWNKSSIFSEREQQAGNKGGEKE